MSESTILDAGMPCCHIGQSLGFFVVFLLEILLMVQKSQGNHLGCKKILVNNGSDYLSTVTQELLGANSYVYAAC